MTPEQWAQAQKLCLEAEDLPEAEQEAFLHTRCGDDQALFDQVLSMLRNVQHTQGILDRSAIPSTGRTEGTEEQLPPALSLGPWQIGALVGRGGMGEVYEARRADGAFELRAAVKLLKRGLDTDSVVRRFLRERRILAQLAHPNIAHLLDAGVAPDGRPYLVMEFVEGLPITHYASSRVLPIHELLTLMLTVCDAVQVAHVRHIVHRDLKPSNVLVTPEGKVKLLDFGIAKLLDDEEGKEETKMQGESTPFTPEYAAPEQILGAQGTTASDVYSLGVILMELLTERLPHQRRGQSATEIALSLNKETVERPSTILRRERGRLSEPVRLARLKAVTRDLDLIVLKALHADPARRYATAQEFGDDLMRLMHLQPVLARPDSRAYRVGRYIRRNRLVVSAASAVMLALTLGLAAALWQAQAAIAARNDALRRQQQADDLLQFMLVDLRDKLLPLGKLSVLDAVGVKAMEYFASLDQKDQTESTLGARATALRQIGDLRIKQGDMKGALAAFGEALKLDEALLKRQPKATQVLHNLGESEFSMGYAYYSTGALDDARPWLERYLKTALRLAKLEPKNPQWRHRLVQAYVNLGALTYSAGDLAKARTLFVTAREVQQPLTQSNPDNKEYLSTLADLHGWLHTIDAAQRDWPSAFNNASIESQIYRQLSRQEPQDAGYQHALTEADLRALADEMHLRSIRTDAANLLEALQLTQQLLANDADNIEYAHSRLVALRVLVESHLQANTASLAGASAAEQLALAQATYAKAPSKSQVIDDLLVALVQSAKVALMVAEPRRAQALLADAQLEAMSAEQQKSATASNWLDLRLWQWFLATSPETLTAAKQKTEALMGKLSSTGVAIKPELMFRYQALKGADEEASLAYSELSTLERSHPILKRFCTVHRACR